MLQDEIRSGIVLLDAANMYGVNRDSLLEKITTLSKMEAVALEFWAYGYWRGPGSKGEDEDFFRIYAGFVGSEAQVIQLPTVVQ